MPDLTLSFDNGPDPAVTPQVLDVLARRGILATFFVIGRKIADPGGRALMERAREAGHWIGNHSFSHSVPLGLDPDPDIAQREIEPTQALIGSCAHPARWFRPFGGGGNLDDRLLRSEVVEHLLRHRYSCVLWNAVPRDWDDPEGWVDRALGQWRSQPWSLMVLHDIPTGAMDRLEQFLDSAAAAGARFRQDFPPECVPVRGGTIALPLDRFVRRS